MAPFQVESIEECYSVFATPARAGDGLVGFALGFFLFLAFAAVVEFFAFGHGHFAFGDAIPEINLGRDDGHAFLLGLDQQPVNLSPVQQQFALPQRFVIARPAGQVLRDVAIDQPGFAAANLGERFAKRTFSFPEVFTSVPTRTIPASRLSSSS